MPTDKAADAAGNGKRTLIRNAAIFTAAPGLGMFETGHLVIRGPIIEAVGKGDPPPGDYDRQIDASGCLVTPGLINTHQHPWYTLFRGLGRGKILEDWHRFMLRLAGTLTPRAIEIGTRLLAAESIVTGTTCFFNHSVLDTTEDILAAATRPTVETGVRQVYGYEIRPKGLSDRVRRVEELVAAYNRPDSLLRFAVVTEINPHWVKVGTSSEEAIHAAYDLAKRFDSRVSSHAAGGTLSRERGYLESVIRLGRTPFHYLHQIGVLDHHWLFAHGIWANDRDIELLGQAGVSLSHNPTSEAARGGGIAPVALMLKAGINVTLGTDGPMVDDSIDMVEQMKVAALLQRQRHLSSDLLPPEHVIEMATRRSAAAIGLDSEIGTLEPGKRADIVAFNLDQVHLGVVHDPCTTLVNVGRGADARWVWVDGQLLLDDGKPTWTDEETLREMRIEGARIARECMHKAQAS